MMVGARFTKSDIAQLVERSSIVSKHSVYSQISSNSITQAKEGTVIQYQGASGVYGHLVGVFSSSTGYGMTIQDVDSS